MGWLFIAVPIAAQAAFTWWAWNDAYRQGFDDGYSRGRGDVFDRWLQSTRRSDR